MEQKIEHGAIIEYPVRKLLKSEIKLKRALSAQRKRASRSTLKNEVDSAMTKRNQELNNENYYIDTNSASNVCKHSFISRDNSIVDLNQQNHQDLIYVKY